jgi:hypothetical protein
MTDSPDGEPACFGALGKLDGDGRLVVPAELRHTVPWLKGAKPIRLLAELRERGRVRIHPLEQALNRLDRLRNRILENHPQKLEALAALGDRYREVSYYPSDTRLHLPLPISAYLGSQDSSCETYYIETRGSHIDVMTLALREERLKLLMADLDLPET